MKKLLFSALACVAFAFSGFASNEVVKEENVLNQNNLIEKYVFSEDDGCTICTLTTYKFNSDGTIRSESSQLVKVCNVTCAQANEKLAKQLEPTLDNPKIDYVTVQ